MSLDGWYVALFLGLLVGSIFSKSLLLNLGLIFTCVLGTIIASQLDATSTVIYGFTALFLMVAGFAIIQILTKVEHI